MVRFSKGVLAVQVCSVPEWISRETTALNQENVLLTHASCVVITGRVCYQRCYPSSSIRIMENVEIICVTQTQTYLAFITITLVCIFY